MDNPQRKDIVILVHGTFAAFENSECKNLDEAKNADEKNDRGRWWIRNSDFVNRLHEQIPEAIIAPSPDVIQQGSPDAVFHWSGRNSEDSRRKGGHLLLKHLRAFCEYDCNLNLIAHSHGGNLLLEALRLDEKSSTLKAKVKTWTTIGTPFLHFIPDVRKLWSLVILLAACLVIWHQWNWLIDFWGFKASILGISPVWLACKLGITSTLMTLAIGLTIRFVYALSLYLRAQRAPGDILFAQFRFAKEAAIGLISVLVLTGIWFWFGNNLTKGEHSLSELDNFLATKWLLLVVGILLYAFFELFCFTAALINCFRRRKSLQKTWETWHEKYYSIACLNSDEAIRLLQESQEGIYSRIVPRMPDPGANEFFPNGKQRAPELTRSQSISPQIMFEIIRDWVVRPFYNHVVAELLDRFLCRRMEVKVHGADIPGERLGFVSSTPLPLPVERKTFSKWSIHSCLVKYFSPAYPFLSQEEATVLDRQSQGRIVDFDACDTLEEEANNSWPQFIGRLRKQIWSGRSGALEIDEMINQAMEGKPDWSKLLVHTTYFSKIATQAAQIVSGQATFNEKARDTLCETPKTVSWPPTDHVWAALRFILSMTIRLTAVIALYLLGWYSLYPNSRDAAEDNAIKPQIALEVMRSAINESGVPDTLMEPVGKEFSAHAPLYSEWLAAMYARGHRREAMQFLNSLANGKFAAGTETAVKATAAMRLAQMGLTKEAKQLLEAPDSVSIGPTTCLTSTIEGAKRFAEFTYGDRDSLSEKPHRSNQLNPQAKYKLLKEAEIRFSANQYKSEANEETQAWQLAIADLSKVLRFRTTNSVPIIPVALSPEYILRAKKWLEAAKSSPGNVTYKDIKGILIVHAAAAQSKVPEIAELSASSATILAKELQKTKKNRAVQAYCLISSVCRYPEKVDRESSALLSQAEQLQSQILTKGDLERLNGYLAGGYALRGYFDRTNNFLALMRPEERLYVSKQALLFLIEQSPHWTDGTALSHGQLTILSDDEFDPFNLDSADFN